MTKPLHTLLLTFTLLSCLTIHVISSKSYVQEACSITKYQDLCIKSLASYSSSARRSPSRWARAGVSVTITEVKSVHKYLTYLKTHNYNHVKGSRNKGALIDCIECIQDSLDNLHKSLRTLRRLSGGGRFGEQMNDALTWLSASLTDQDTCLDGFEGRRGNKEVSRVCDKVRNASYITSNALALVNKLATTGIHDLGGHYP